MNPGVDCWRYVGRGQIGSVILRVGRRQRKRQASGEAEPSEWAEEDPDSSTSPISTQPVITADGPIPALATMHSLTVEMIRLLIRISMSHADEIGLPTARSLEYCLTKMKKYARDDWLHIRDLQPLLSVLKRSLSE
jgi:hypothetical protein